MHEMKTLTLNGETFDSFVDQTARQKADEAVRTVNGKNPDENGNIEIKVNAADAAEVAALVARAETAATAAEAAKESVSTSVNLAGGYASTAHSSANRAEQAKTSAQGYASSASSSATRAEEAATRAEEAAANAGNGSGGNVDFQVGETLKLENGILSVNTTDNVEQDNTLPITSAGVFATVGNIEALLKTI